MRQALAAGADMINDIYGFRRDGALQAVADSNCGLCIMHMQGEPKTMQQMPRYDDILIEVEGFLREIGRAHVGTPVTNAHLVCRLLLEKKKLEFRSLHHATPVQHPRLIKISIYIPTVKPNPHLFLRHPEHKN